MNQDKQLQLSRRERQIMDVIYEHKEVSAQEVRKLLPNPPGYSAVRAMLGKLVDKELINFRSDGPRYIYFPVIEKEKARETALKKMLKTFFDGSTIQAVNALLGMQSKPLSEEEIKNLQDAIKKSKKNN